VKLYSTLLLYIIKYPIPPRYTLSLRREGTSRRRGEVIALEVYYRKYPYRGAKLVPRVA